ncbi:hypothetical protein GlitD10_0609 [Gloeomargarita lithophora Alchichica-D10]|uniref:Uncharacterized protein n=1 Tax=Gloeomargarita lithophora Alchichica-D10 TaxID=1188229 RepID=A0A1J0AAG1_9CYAN|nr:hypothetical protein [Gloeomargarita lithophora]APB32923.1 hypothetical protein GlitD10_0609 [Gloeomargarita lithophora Alchichica-D10]
MAILEKDKTYLFSQFCELPQPPEKILAELGYTLHINTLTFPTQNTILPRIAELRSSLEKRIQLTPLTTEQARRETLISPILFAIVELLNLKLLIEYPISGKRGQGSVDYLNDLTRGFTQLAVEMSELGDCYGVLTTGTIWQFAKLKGNAIYQDLNLYRVPNGIVELVSILLGVLAGDKYHN